MNESERIAEAVGLAAYMAEDRVIRQQLVARGYADHQFSESTFGRGEFIPCTRCEIAESRHLRPVKPWELVEKDRRAQYIAMGLAGYELAVRAVKGSGEHGGRAVT